MKTEDDVPIGDYLVKRGWRKIGQRHNKYGITFYWDHPDHQPDERGAFTTHDAFHHQAKVTRNGQCDCIKRPQ